MNCMESRNMNINFEIKKTLVLVWQELSFELEPTKLRNCQCFDHWFAYVGWRNQNL